MKSCNKIYLAALIFFSFSAGTFFDFYEDKREATASSIQIIPIDTPKGLKQKIDTIYQNKLIRQTALSKIEQIKNYVEDTLAPALEGKQIIIKKEPVIMPIVFPAADSAWYYKHLYDSIKKECNFYKTSYQNFVIHSGNRLDTLFKNDSTINLFVKNRWQYKNVFGVPISRTGYTDIYSDNKNVKVISIKQDQPAFGMRLQALGTYNIYTDQFNTGLALRFEGRTIQGTMIYYYNFNTMKFYPVISLNKDIFRIR